jgi:hypothetical protein
MLLILVCGAIFPQTLHRLGQVNLHCFLVNARSLKSVHPVENEVITAETNMNRFQDYMQITLMSWQLLNLGFLVVFRTA